MTSPLPSSSPKSAPAADVRICPLDEIPLGLGRAFEVGGKAIAIFRLRTGKVHAITNCCPHRGAPLADGMLAGDRVVCPFHAFRFELASGHCDQQDVCEVEVFPVRVESGWVVLTIPTRVTASLCTGPTP